MGEQVLRLENIDAYYNELKAISGINLHIDRSEIVGILGPNGAGKSTTLKTIFGIIRPKQGAVVYNGDDISTVHPHKRAEMGISYVPEGGKVFSKLTVEENLLMGAFVRRDRQGVSSDLMMVYSLFPALAARKTKLGSTLSGGERQMLAIGRCLMLRPQLILLDEPSLGLAPIIVDEIYQKIQEIQQENRVTIIIVEQNALKALSIVDRAYLYTIGEVFMEGVAGELLNNPKVKQTFLGS